jgi:hypothetical protein
MARKPTRPVLLDLLVYTFGDMHLPLADSLSIWLSASARFYDFFATYRDKIRKKVRTSQDVDSLYDLQAELAVAYLLLQDRRCTVEYEKHGVGRQRAPDLTVIFKSHTPFNVEVTRLRSSLAAADLQADKPSKLVNTLCDKLGQLPPSVINLLALVANAELYTSEDIRKAFQTLHAQAAAKDDTFFARRNLTDVRQFHRQQQRLSAVWLCAMHSDEPLRITDLWLNPQARHPLSKELKNLFGALALFMAVATTLIAPPFLRPLFATELAAHGEIDTPDAGGIVATGELTRLG